MNIRARAIAAWLCAAVACLGFATTAQSAGYPEKPIRLVVGFPAGGGADYVARQVAKNLSELLGQGVLVENKPGANGIIAATDVARAPADGYTLLLGVTATQSINPALYSKLPYDPLRDFTPITEVGFTPLVLVVNPKLPVRTVPEFIAYVKQNEGSLSFASAGNGNITHMAAELFIQSTGIQKLQHVPYKGSSQAITDLMGGQVTAYFDTLPSSMPFITSGQLRALGVSGGERSAAVPQVPTIQEAGVAGYEATAWFGLFGPAKMPAEVTNKLYQALRTSFAGTEAKQQMASRGIELVVDEPAHFGQMLKEDVARWKNVTTKAGITLE
ncbi:MAG: tripartite tricarboxylate transporter substrate binding protein [Variovorax sp.]